MIAGEFHDHSARFLTAYRSLIRAYWRNTEIRKVGVAGHPEGSPDISKDKLANAIRDKNNWAKNSDMEAYITTQFCFEVPSIITWEKNIRRDGNKLPIHIGIPGPATLNTLIKFATMSGIGPSNSSFNSANKKSYKTSFYSRPFIS